MRRALSRNLSAQIYSQVVTLGVQLGSVPILISNWGLELFGIWMLLTALPNYLTFSDLGFTFIAKNDMSVSVSRGDRAAALVTYQSIFVLLLFILCTLALIIGVGILAIPLDDILILGPVSIIIAQQTLVLLVAKVFLYQMILLLSAGVRCEGRPAREAAFTATLRLLEGLVLMVIVISNGSPVAAATGMLAVYCTGLIAIWFWLRVTTPWLTLGFRHAQRARLTALLSPSISYMLIPLGMATLIHAPVIFLGVVAGPTTVALYSVTRTVARLGTAASNVINNSFVPEYSFAWGRNDKSGFRARVRVHTVLTAMIVCLYAILSVWLIPAGVQVLSDSEITVPTPLVFALLAAVITEMLWTASFAPLSAINQHGLVARTFFFLAVLSLGALAFMSRPVAMAICVALVGGMTLVVTLLQLRIMLRTMRGQGSEGAA